jgi:hypothetical protein
MQAPTRAFATRTLPRQGGHGKEAAGHGDHHDHVHNVFEDGPFKKWQAGLVVFGGLSFGVGAIVFAFKFQNKKHGFA